MVYRWGIGAVWVSYKRCSGGILVVCWWYTCGVLVVCWWCIGGIWMVYGWCIGGVCMVHWGCYMGGVCAVSGDV